MAVKAFGLALLASNAAVAAVPALGRARSVWRRVAAPVDITGDLLLIVAASERSRPCDGPIVPGIEQ